jgi:hypothetical protein
VVLFLIKDQLVLVWSLVSDRASHLREDCDLLVVLSRYLGPVTPALARNVYGKVQDALPNDWNDATLVSQNIDAGFVQAPEAAAWGLRAGGGLQWAKPSK